NRFCPTSSKLPEDYARTIREVPGVRDVMPVQVWTNNCRASLDIVVFNGAEPAQLRENRGLTLLSGDWATFESRRDAALVGRSLAARRGLAVGDTFSIGDLSVEVAGTFASPVASEENVAFTSLEFLQYTRGLDSAGLVTMHEVALAPDADPDAVARDIDAALAAGPVATTTRRKGAFQASTLSDLVDLIGFAHWLGFACVGLVLALVATTTVMAVQDRVKEHAVLQTLGVRPSRVFGLVVCESLLICLLGGLVGTAAATAILAFGGLAVGAEGVAIAFRPSLSLVATAAAVSAVVGLLAGVVPAWHAARTNIVAALNAA
ncbi:ABC transporter permease, partial [Alienimonas sp. DA493]|uniref:ABC transporter permease n=1 Tax=Alienimonas sp. DA493 TaxID=3373605 RepID=UPI0037546A0C